VREKFLWVENMGFLCLFLEKSSGKARKEMFECNKDVTFLAHLPFWFFSLIVIEFGKFSRLHLCFSIAVLLRTVCALLVLSCRCSLLSILV
jgi:hypothetical protein